MSGEPNDAVRAVELELERRRIAAAIDSWFARSCRDWSPRAWTRPGVPRADARCDPPIATLLELNDDLDAAPRPIENWRELAFRRASRYSCGIDPFHFRDRFCTPGYSFAAARRSDG